MPFTRDRLTWANYLLLGYFAYLVNAFGPVMTFLRAELRLSYTVASLHTSAYALGAILSGLLAARAVGRWGRRVVCWTGACGMALGCVGLTVGTSSLVTIGSAGLMGLLGGLVVILVQATLADRHGALRGTAFAESNVVAGVGGMLAPLLVSAAERSGVGLAERAVAGGWGRPGASRPGECAVRAGRGPRDPAGAPAPGGARGPRWHPACLHGGHPRAGGSAAYQSARPAHGGPPRGSRAGA